MMLRVGEKKALSSQQLRLEHFKFVLMFQQLHLNALEKKMKEEEQIVLINFDDW